MLLIVSSEVVFAVVVVDCSDRCCCCSLFRPTLLCWKMVQTLLEDDSNVAGRWFGRCWKMMVLTEDNSDEVAGSRRCCRKGWTSIGRVVVDCSD